MNAVAVAMRDAIIASFIIIDLIEDFGCEGV
jgi:hypothetical protein